MTISGFKIRKTADETVYVLEDGTSGGTTAGAIASVAMPVGSVIKRNPGKQKSTKKPAKGNLVVSESQYKWSDYESVPSMADRLSIFEAFVEHNFNLLESNDNSLTDYFLKLNSTAVTPVENNQYIVVLLGLVNNQVLEMQPIELATFLKKDGDYYIIKLNNGSISKFPNTTVRDSLVMNTLFFDSESAYDKFRSIVALKFNKLLSDFVDDTVDEDANPCWKGYKKIGNKMKNDKSVPNCVKNESVDTYTARLQEALDNKIASSPPPRNFVAKNAKTAGAGAHSDKSKTIPRHQKHKDNFKESEGSPEGVPHVSKKLLQHIVQQIGTDGVQALVKSLKWGDGAAKELLTLITQNLKQSAQEMKEASLQEKIPKGADVDYYIKDFSKSNAPQFKNKTAEKKKRMAIAAYYASKQKIKENTVILEGRDAPLYHFTTMQNFRKIIETDSLIASGRGKIYFTRDYRRQFVPGQAAREGEGIGFRIDQSKLARTFGNKLQAGGQNTVRGTNYDKILSQQGRQEWLDDPRNAWTIQQHEKNPTGQSMSRTNGNNAADIIRGTTAQGARWESEEWLMTTALPNFHTYVTGLVIQEAGGAKGRTKPSEDILSELANYFIKQYAGKTGFETRNLLIDYAIKMKIPFVYRQRDIDATQLKKRIIQIFADRKNSRM